MMEISSSDVRHLGIMLVIREVSNGFIVECEGVTFCIQGEGTSEDIERALMAAKTLYLKMAVKT